MFLKENWYWREWEYLASLAGFWSPSAAVTTRTKKSQTHCCSNDYADSAKKEPPVMWSCWSHADDLEIAKLNERYRKSHNSHCRRRTVNKKQIVTNMFKTWLADTSHFTTRLEAPLIQNSLSGGHESAPSHSKPLPPVPPASFQIKLSVSGCTLTC